jgi:hypothetical protein
VNGYIEAGYTVVLGTLAVYAVTLVQRERAARARLGPERPAPEPESEDE